MGILDANGNPYAHNEPKSIRDDSSSYSGATFQNELTGVGTARDKTTFGHYSHPWRLQDQEILAMYNGSDIAEKIVEIPVKEMFRRGWTVKSKDVNAESQAKLTKKANKIRANEILFDGAMWGRLFGGALVIIGAEDGQPSNMPLNEDNVKTIHYMNVIDRRFVWVQSYYSDMLSPNYGLPEVYLVTNVVSNGGMRAAVNNSNASVVSIHESRCIRFDGSKTDVLTRQQLAGWSWSVLQRAYDAMRRFDGAFDSVGNLMSDAAQAVWKIKGLISMIAQNQKAQLQSRMQLADLSRSALRAIMVDAEGEDFERKPTPLAGIPEILDRYMMRLAAAANMPVTRLFGRSAAGMNATGESDVKFWLDNIASQQENELSPKIKRVYTILAMAKDSGVKASVDTDFEVVFNPLYQPTDAEQADTELKTSQKDIAYIGSGVLTPEQVALSRWGTGKFSQVTTLGDDAIAALQKAVEGAIKFDPYENEPEPSGANAPGQGEQQSPAVPMPLPGAPSLAK